MQIAVIGSGTASTELPPHFAPLCGPGQHASLVTPRLSAFAFTPYEELLVDVGYVDAVQSAVAAGAAAVMINSFADYGQEAASAAVAVPVIGAGAATLRAAAANGRKFAIVTVWPASMGFIYRERLRALELTNRCVGVWHLSPESELAQLGDTGGVMQRMARHEGSVIEQLAKTCADAIAAGAEAIALGCTCMAPVGPALQARVAVPVLESSRCGFVEAAAAAMAVAAAAASRSGQDQPRQAPMRDTTRIPALVNAWFGSMPAGTQPAAQTDADCSFCIVEEKT